MVSVGGNLDSVPDTTRRRIFDVHVLADEVRIFEDGALVATHAPLEGRGEKARSFSLQTGQPSPPAAMSPEPHSRRRPGFLVARCTFYAAAGCVSQASEAFSERAVGHTARRIRPP